MINYTSNEIVILSHEFRADKISPEKIDNSAK